MENTMEIIEVEKPNEKITKRLSLFSPTEDLKKTLSSETELPADGFWAIATVEMVDMAGDVVKVDGLSWDEYHQPPTKYMKIVADHNNDLPTGDPAVIGRVERFVKTSMVVKGKSLPTLAFYMTWAKDPDGQVSGLAAKYKAMYDGPTPYMESFSMGFLSNDYEPNDTGGLNYNTSILYHIGAVAVPCNTMANVVRSLDVKTEEKINELVETVAKQQEIISKQAEMIVKMSMDNEQMMKSVKSLEESASDNSNNILKRFDSVADRLDDIEARVVTSSVTRPQTSDRKRVDAKDLSDINDILKKYAGR